MTLFDLLFLALILAVVVTLVAAGVAAVQGRRVAALTMLRRLAVSAVVYLGVIAAVSFASPQRFAAIGDDQCSDDWCIAVIDARHHADAQGVRYDVTFRISSKARRASQRELGVVAYLRDGLGRRFDAVTRGEDIPFDHSPRAAAAATISRTFDVPADASDVGLVIAREGGMRFPGCCIIGDEGSLFHKRTVVRL